MSGVMEQSGASSSHQPSVSAVAALTRAPISTGVIA